jgi:peptidoglycan hydrolase-like protein with peptidoglycan-binding domain
MRKSWMAGAAALALTIPAMGGPAAAAGFGAMAAPRGQEVAAGATLVGGGSAAVRDAQGALSQHGFDPGPADGMMGARTREALMDFQRQNNLPATGRLDSRTAQALNVQPDAGMGRTGRASRAEPRDERDRAYMGGGMVGGATTGAGSGYGEPSGAMGGGRSGGTMTPGYNTGSTGPSGTSNLGSGNQPATGGTSAPR